MLMKNHLEMSKNMFSIKNHFFLRNKKLRQGCTTQKTALVMHQNTNFQLIPLKNQTNPEISPNIAGKKCLFTSLRCMGPGNRICFHIDAWRPEASMPGCNVGRLAGLAWVAWLDRLGWLAKFSHARRSEEVGGSGYLDFESYILHMGV